MKKRSLSATVTTVNGVEAVKSFCLCNAFKYHWRCRDKNGEEDLQKADWYMTKYKELVNM